MRRKMKNQKGFTLVEVMISMLIFAIGILGMAPMMVTSMFGNAYSREETQATVLAQDKFEKLGKQASISPLPWTETTNNLYTIYSRDTRVDDNSTDNTVPVGLYKMRVTMSWTDKAGKQRSLVFLTYKVK